MTQEHKDAIAAVPPGKSLVGQKYKGWDIDWEYGWYTATGPNYDASYEGPEDGWVSNGHRVQARTITDLFFEVDDFLEENPDAR